MALKVLMERCHNRISCQEAGVIAVSIVSHGQGDLLKGLVEALLLCPEVQQVLVTMNIPEKLSLVSSSRVRLIENAVQKGFGANHNAAFSYCEQPFFCPMNPDISLKGNPFGDLLTAIDKAKASLAAPLVLSRKGDVEDNLRYFPTITSLLRKIASGADGRYALEMNSPDFYPEWVAGMFILFRSAEYARLGGFDESFFLYYEDVDICVRAWKTGMKVVACPSVVVVHDARRESHRNTRYFRFHVVSMARYFWKHWNCLPHVSRTVLGSNLELRNKAT